jgi:sirohydrochlorin ferrochelatase
LTPTLLAVAHGTHEPAGPATVRALLDRVRALRPWLPVAESYAEIAAPSLEEAVRRIDGPVVAVPLLLARGYHALIDIPGRVREVCPRAAVARPLGPHALLGTAVLARLSEAARGVHPGAAALPAGRGAISLAALRMPGTRVVLGAAGSSDPAGIADVRTAARLLAGRLRRPVPYGFVAAGEPALADVVAGLRRDGAERVVVAAYLLAPGFFHQRMVQAGADAVSAPLGDHDAIARLVLRRFDEARDRSRTTVAIG